MRVRLKAALVLDTIACGKRSMNSVQNMSDDRAARRGERPRRLPAASAVAATSATTAPAAQTADATSTPSCIDERPGQEGGHGDGRDRRDPRGDRPRALLDRAGGLEAEEDRAVGEEERQGRHAAEQRIGLQQREQRRRCTRRGASIGTPWTMLAQPTPHSSAGRKLPTMIAHSQRVRQRLRVALAPELEPDVAHDQADQDQEEREVEAGEERRVPLREGRERGAPGDDQPDLVAVPHGPDRVQHGAALGLVVADARACSIPTPKSKPSSTK